MRNSFHAHAITQPGHLSISFESRPHASPTPQWWAVIQLTWVVYTQMYKDWKGKEYLQLSKKGYNHEGLSEVQKAFHTSSTEDDERKTGGDCYEKQKQLWYRMFILSHAKGGSSATPPRPLGSSMNWMLQRLYATVAPWWCDQDYPSNLYSLRGGTDDRFCNSCGCACEGRNLTIG